MTLELASVPTDVVSSMFICRWRFVPRIARSLTAQKSHPADVPAPLDSFRNVEDHQDRQQGKGLGEVDDCPCRRRRWKVSILHLGRKAEVRTWVTSSE